MFSVAFALSEDSFAQDSSSVNQENSYQAFSQKYPIDQEKNGDENSCFFKKIFPFFVMEYI